MSINDDLTHAAAAVHSADALLITAGAGMGVDSGLPDFRGTTGFWKAYPAIAKLGLSFAEMANPAWFGESPNLAWAFYGHRLNLYRATAPHRGFKQLLELAAAKPKNHFVFTSNVDGQFQKAGFTADRIVECHGSIHHFQCTAPCCDAIWDAGNEILTLNEESFLALDPLPRCPHCKGLARPNILMFGDSKWLGDRTEFQQNLFHQWLDELEKCSASLAVIELGAGMVIPTVRHASERAARRRNGRLIRINPRESQVPKGHFGFPFGAADGIHKLCELVQAS